MVWYHKDVGRDVYYMIIYYVKIIMKIREMLRENNNHEIDCATLKTTKSTHIVEMINEVVINNREVEEVE